MRQRLRRVGAAVLVTAALAAASCAAERAPAGAPTGDTLPDSVAAGSVAVSADPALTGALTDGQSRLAVDNSALKVTLRFIPDGASLARSGAVDLVVATTESLDALKTAGVVDTPQPFARDTLQIVIAPGNPLGITSAADLARPGLRFALPNGDDAPSRGAALRVLAAVGASPAQVAAANAASAITAVHDGLADAAIVYSSEGVDGNADLTVSVAPELDAGRLFAIAIVQSTKQRGAAKGYIEQLLYGTGSQVIQGRGFLLP